MPPGRFNPDNPGEFLVWCFQNAVTVMVLSFTGLVRKVRIKSGRSHARPDGTIRTEDPRGEALVNLPLQAAIELKGPKDEMNIYLLVIIPRAAYEQAKSPIILPGLSDVRRTH